MGNRNTILLDGIKIYAFHGCFEEERLRGTNFLIDVELDTDLEKAAKSDNIDDTVNYQTVFKLIQEQMAIPSNLLEHVVDRTIDVLFEKFPTIENISFKLSKLNPPLGGKIDAVCVKMVRDRNEFK